MKKTKVMKPVPQGNRFQIPQKFIDTARRFGDVDPEFLANAVLEHFANHPPAEIRIAGGITGILYRYPLKAA